MGKVILKYSWAIYFLICFTLVFLVLFPFFLILLSHPKLYKFAHFLRKIWGWILFVLTGLWPKVYKDSQYYYTKPCIIVANHFSYLDILAVNVLLPHFFIFMAKAELAKVPLFGIFFRTIDIPVNRKSKKQSLEAYQLANQRIAKGQSILIFPEGGIGANVPPLQKFKSGAFRMAIENKIPILPITIIDSWKRMPGGGVEQGGTPGRFRIFVHRPIETIHLNESDIETLSNQVYSIIENKFLSYHPKTTWQT